METRCITGWVGRPQRSLRRRSALGLFAALTASVLVWLPTASAQFGALVVSEIYYNAPGADEGMEFVEILNPTGAPIDIAAYALGGGIDFVFAEGASIGPGASVVVAADSVAFAAKFGFEPTGSYSRSLSNSSDIVELRDASGGLVDQVQYRDYAPWPVSADGDGDSLQLVDPAADNSVASAWLAGPPTPAAANRPTASVLFSHERGFYNNSLTVTLAPSVAGAGIQYALDGGSFRTYTGPVYISDNGGVQGLSARTVMGATTSVIQTHSYVFAPDRGTPVVVKWNNGMSRVDGDEWTGSFEFIAPPSVPLESVGANAGWRPNTAGISSNQSEKVYFRSEYGAGTLRADLFSDVSVGPIDPEPRIDQLALRNQQGDPTRVKQLVSHDALASLGLLSPHGRFVHLYEDGGLSGIRQMQERPEGGFMETYTGHDKSLWNSTNWTTDGLLGAVNNAANQPTLDEFRRVANLDHFIGYSLVDFLASDGDGWWKKNWRLTGPADAAAANGDDFAWHFFLWDEDDAWGSSNWSPSRTNAWPKSPYESVEFLFVDLMDVLEFRFLWADAAECAYRNGGPLSQQVMYPRVVERVNELAQLGPTNSAFLTTMSTWMDQRSTWLFGEFVDDGLYPRDSPVVVTPRGGRLGPSAQVTVGTSSGHSMWYTVDGTDPRNPDGSLSSTALPVSNGRISLGVGSHQVIVRSYDPGDSDPFQRWSAACPLKFERGVQTSSVVINEIHYNPADQGELGDPAHVDGDRFEFIELHNGGLGDVSLSGWEFSSGIDYQFAPGTTLAAGGYLVLASDATQFARRYGFAPDGEYGSNLSNAGELVELSSGDGTIVDSVSFDDADPWPVPPDGQGYSLVLVEPLVDNSHPLAWTASADLHGDPGVQNRFGEPGDINGNSVLDNGDVVALLESQIGAADPISAHLGDLTGDSVVDLADALELAQLVHAANGG